MMAGVKSLRLMEIALIVFFEFMGPLSQRIRPPAPRGAWP